MDKGLLFRISLADTPTASAFDVETAVVEWTVKVEVALPGIERTSNYLSTNYFIGTFGT